MGITAGVAGVAAFGTTVYESNKAASQARNAIPPAPPPPPPAATPATLAQAASATRTKASGGGATASGTVGQGGPQGLQEPLKTANLTLLGGTK